MKQMIVKAPGGLENLTLIDAADACAPGPGEVRVRIHASSLNFHDYMVAKNPEATADGRIPMSDGAGVVEEIGESVTEFAVGDSVVSCFFPDWQDGSDMPSDFSRVPGDGIDGYAREYVTRPASYFTKAPKGWTHEEAATITTAGLTAWRALIVNGGVKAGDTVAVLGTGGVSIYALQIAKAMGASVIATSSSDEKLERVKTLGADHVVNYKSVPEWGEHIRELTGGRGVDHVVEVGGPGTLNQSFNAAKVGGHIALIGVLTGLQSDITTRGFMLKQQRLQGLIVGSRAHQKDFVKALEVTGIKPVVDRTFPMKDLRAAFEHQGAGKHFGKICLEI